MSSDPLLQPLKIKGLTLKNRIMSTSHACGLEDESAMPAEAYQRYHLEKARGGLALTMFGGSAYVASDSAWASGQLNIGSDRIIPHLEQFSERVHEAGAAIMMQITHLGRRAETNSQNWLPTIAPSVVRETGHRSFPQEMDKHDIDRVVRAFGDAAVRAQTGGLDGLETMVGGHLIGQFLSPVTNKRTDRYGGSLDNRCRFGLEVHEEIRRRVGHEFIVGMRLQIESDVDQLPLEECVQIARLFSSYGLVDYYNANFGRIDTELALAEICMPGMSVPIAPWLKRVGDFKRDVDLPVFHAARITDLSSARHAINEGLVDMVAMTRAHIADPNIVNKIVRGEEERIRPCVGSQHCMGVNRPTCVHNAAAGREQFWPQVVALSSGPKLKVVVVGGGPAGLEAARVSAERGHSVVLLEAADKLGGQLRMAQAASWRRDVAGIVDWRVQELEVLGVDVQLNHYAEAGDVLAHEPDVVVVATGGVPQLDWLDGEEHCTSAWDILSGAVPAADSVIVYDGTGRHPAPSAAEVCQTAGARVELVMLDDRPAAELAYAERAVWKRRLAEMDMPLTTEHRLRSVEPVGNRLAAHFEHELIDRPLTLYADQIVVEHGTVPADEVFQSLRGQSGNDGVIDLDALINGRPQPAPEQREDFLLYRIGDAVSSRNLAAAMFDALRLCTTL